MIYDTFSHYMIAKPLTSRSLEVICDMIIRHLFLPFGAPKQFIADNEFFKKHFQGLVTMLKSKASFTSAYHSMGNPAERPLRHIQALLRLWVNCDSYYNDSTGEWCKHPMRDEKDNFAKFGEWPEYLPFVVSAYNASPIPGTNISPFEIVHGRPYRVAADNELADNQAPVAPSSIMDHWKEKKILLDEIFQKVRTVHEERAAQNQLHYSMDHISLDLKKNDLVMVKVPTREGKLANQFIGPCRIIQKLSDVNYIVRDVRTSRDMRVHVQRLSKYHADSRYGPPYETLYDMEKINSNR
jgi:hypothetical protein